MYREVPLSLLALSLMILMNSCLEKARASDKAPDSTERKHVQCGQTHSVEASSTTTTTSTESPQDDQAEKDRPPTNSSVDQRKVKCYQDSQSGQIPFHARILLDGKSNCSGVVIDKWNILTVAKCLVDRGLCLNGRSVRHDASRLKVVVGDTHKSRYDSHEVFAVGKVIVHPGYCTSLAKMDNIGLLRLQDKLSWQLGSPKHQSINRVCLPTTKGQDYYDSLEVFSSGLSYGENRTPLNRLKIEDKMKIVDRDECQRSWSNRTNTTAMNFQFNQAIICARGQNNNQAVCLNDLGGPLYLRSDLINFRVEVIGLRMDDLSVSSNTLPQPFIKVSHYLKWIKLNS